MRLGLAGRNADRFRAAPGDRAHVGVGEAVGLKHFVAGGVDLLDRPGQLEAEQARAVTQPFAVLVELEDLAIIGALSFEHAARIMERVGQHMDSRVAPRDHLAVEPNPAVAVVELALTAQPFPSCCGAATRLVQARSPRQARRASRALRQLGAAPRGGLDRDRDQPVQRWSRSSTASPASVVPFGLATRLAIEAMSSPVVAAIHAVPSTVSRAMVGAISWLRPRARRPWSAHR